MWPCLGWQHSYSIAARDGIEVPEMDEPFPRGRMSRTGINFRYPTNKIAILAQGRRHGNGISNNTNDD